MRPQHVVSLCSWSATWSNMAPTWRQNPPKMDARGGRKLREWGQNPTSPWATGGIEVASGPVPTFQHCFNPSREGFTPPFIPPRGRFWVVPRIGGCLLLPLLGHSVCTVFDARFGILLSWILVLIWPYLASQLGGQMQPKSLQEPSKMHPKSHLVFDHFFDGFWLIF